MDTLEIFGREFTNVTGIKATDSNSGTKVYIRPQGTKSISANGTGIDVTEYASVNVSVPSAQPTLQTKSVSYTPTESAQTQTVTADNGYDGLSQVNVSVGAIDSEYIGSAIDRRSSSDVQFFDDDGYYVAGPPGFYDGNISVEITSGTAGTPTATKGSVSNHSVSVTPSVTNTTGYITGGTKTGTAVTVSASELVSGSETKTANGTYDVTNLASLVVNVASGSSKNVQVLQSTSRTNSSSLTKVLGDLTVSKTGTYDIYWSGGRSNTSTSYTWGTRLYVDGSGYGTENTSWSNNCQSNHLSNVSLTANQKLSVYARGRTGSYYTFAPMLVIIEA